MLSLSSHLTFTFDAIYLVSLARVRRYVRPRSFHTKGKIVRIEFAANIGIIVLNYL